MIVAFKLDTKIDAAAFRGLAHIYSAIQDELITTVADTAQQLIAEWTRSAQVALKNSSSYVHHIHATKVNDLHWVVSNDHPAVLFLEIGTKSFDQRVMLNTSPHVKISREGHKYLIIPFEHTMAAIQEHGISPEELKQLSGSRFLPIGSPTVHGARGREPHRYEWGESLHDVGTIGKRTKKFFSLNPRAVHLETGLPPVHTYEWKTSPFERIYRFVDFKGRTTSYTAFRTMSDLPSQQNAWIHPGIRAMAIAETAVQQVRREFYVRIADSIRRARQNL